ncbi:hypothetical protein Amet_3488 [Alkaliphilus metalliredigens QYMF]|uniref:BioF2-like acetyltransferase domain-containing protein n=1 Tax=Alkaliphilus metalliredigens (strain QYMF) TaxID=293826 RepID=A6TTU8_ALKMQ|nr:GNAT family N-acetyltransferase [Alkaliphilus metalliredigens]ABR49616.1 hypothetical protein Amet_3488 [Alkaliphilus metalliredigens QYMF]
MFHIYHRVEDLPASWDEVVGDHPFLKRSVLKCLQEVNPCKQLYHFNKEKGMALVSYELKLDLFTFSRRLSWRIPVNMIGVPMSVSSCGYAIKEEGHREDLVQYITTLRGFYIMLNSQDHFKFPKGHTLPTYQMQIKWSTFHEYLLDMRSHYRYRIKKAMKRFETVVVAELEDQSLFDEELYSLYEAVYENSKEKLEKLPIEFFRDFPSKIITFTANEETIGFVQLVVRQESLLFIFGGFKHSLNHKYDLYMNMLLYIVDYGIKNGFQSIDFGQTAEETKTKIGAIPHEKRMYLHHHNPVVKRILHRLAPKFSYGQYRVTHHIFKGENHEDPTGKMS